MARKKKETDESQDQVKDQPERDIFDEDEEDTTGPPVLPEGHPDAAVASQDAPGSVPTQQKDESTQADQERAPEATETAANQAVLDMKGDLQPVVDQRDVDPMVTQGNQPQVQSGQAVDTNSPEFKDAVRKYYLAEMMKEGGQTTTRPAMGNVQPPARGDQPQPEFGFKVMRGMVGSFPEGSIIPDLKALGIGERDLQRLLDADVIQAFKPEKS